MTTNRKIQIFTIITTLLSWYAIMAGLLYENVYAFVVGFMVLIASFLINISH